MAGRFGGFFAPVLLKGVTAAGKRRSRHNAFLCQKAFTGGFRRFGGTLYCYTADIQQESGKKLFYSRTQYGRGTNIVLQDTVLPASPVLYPKGTGFPGVTPQDLNAVAGPINTMPRKCLGWLPAKSSFYSRRCA
jgi:hypothetical protein